MGAREAEDLSGGDIEVETVEGDDAPEMLGQSQGQGPGIVYGAVI